MAVRLQLQSFRINESGLRKILNAPDGPVAADMKRRADNVHLAASHLVNERFHQRTGRLQRSLQSVLAVEGGVPVGVVRCDPDVAPHAVFMEFGTDAHPIVPRDEGGWLVSAPGHPDPLLRPQRSVTHPGNAPKPFLEDALAAGFDA